MNHQEARALVVGAIQQVAPELDEAALEGKAHLQDDLQLDSIDFLALIEILSSRAGRRIEEDEYPEFATVDGCVRRLSAED